MELVLSDDEKMVVRFAKTMILFIWIEKRGVFTIIY